MINLRDKLPEGERGDARISHFEVSDEDASFFNLRCDINARPQDRIEAGEYVRLHVGGGQPMMSNTPAEIASNSEFLANADGRVLIAGLGIGMVIDRLRSATERGIHGLDVESFTVVERNPNVIALVEPYLAGPDLTIIEADIHKWSPPEGETFDTVYFDIWPEICTDNLREIAVLIGRARRDKWAGDDGWIGAWQERELKAIAAREEGGW